MELFNSPARVPAMSERSSKKPHPRYVLVVEDNVHHAELITEVLDRHFAPVIIHTVDTIEDAVEFVTQSDYDLILTAGVIRDIPVTETIPKLSKISGGSPIVVISGRGDEKLAAEYIKKGAAEYLGKTRETLESLHTLLLKHFSKKRSQKSKSLGRKTGESRGSPTSAAFIKELDTIAQQALALTSPKRRKRRLHSPDVEQLDHLLGQIQRLRSMASKLTPKE